MKTCWKQKQASASPTRFPTHKSSLYHDSPSKLVRERIIYQRFIWFLTIPRFRWPEENAGSTIRDSTSPKLHSTVEKPRNDALITGPSRPPSCVSSFEALSPLFALRVPYQKAARPKEYPEQNETVKEFFVLSIKRKKKNFSAYKKSCSSCFWLYALNSASIPIPSFCPLPFSCCVFHFFSSWKKIFSQQKNHSTQLRTHMTGELYLFSSYQNHFILKIAIEKRVEHDEQERIYSR